MSASDSRPRGGDDPRVLEKTVLEVLLRGDRVGDGWKGESGGAPDLTTSISDLDAIRAAFASAVDSGGPGRPEGAPGLRDRALPRFPGFTVLGKLGQGGFGAVYRARDDKLGREVALKVMLPGPGLAPCAREDFLREARTLARIRHPNVLSIHAVLEDGDAIALALELIEGSTLADIVEEQGPFGAAEAAQVGAALCRALAAVHGAGLVHRDVKTSNVLRERGGRVVLADFGLGVAMAPAASRPGAEPAPEEQSVAGSPLFMSPEQALGERLDRRSDLYAAGVVLYHIATGRFPVDPSPIPDLLGRIVRGDLVPIRDARPDLPEAFCRAVSRALARDPTARFASAGEMERALLDCAGARPGDGAPAPPRRARISRRAAIVLGSTGVLAATLALLLPLVGAAPRFRVEEATWMALGPAARELRDGDAVRVGTEVRLRFRADRDLHVYVLNEDEKGERYLLFPLAGGESRNPVRGRIGHVLPGRLAGAEASWLITSAGGAEHLFIVASPRPLPSLESLAPGATPGPVSFAAAYPRVGASEAGEVLRGVGGVKLERRATSEGGQLLLARYIDGLGLAPGGSGEANTGVWVRKLSLRNP